MLCLPQSVVSLKPKATSLKKYRFALAKCDFPPKTPKGARTDTRTTPEICPSPAPNARRGEITPFRGTPHSDVYTLKVDLTKSIFDIVAQPESSVIPHIITKDIFHADAKKVLARDCFMPEMPVWRKNVRVSD